MGFQHGYGNEDYFIERQGVSFNAHPDAMDPTIFLYDVGQPPFVESWYNGLVVIHNPNATHPLSPEYFGPMLNVNLNDGRLVHTVVEWHPISSITMTIKIGDIKNKLPRQFTHRTIVAVEAIPREQFVDLVGYSYENNEVFKEHGWFADMSYSFVGVVLFDHSDENWNWVLLARDPKFVFRTIESDGSIRSCLTAPKVCYIAGSSRV